MTPAHPLKVGQYAGSLSLFLLSASPSIPIPIPTPTDTNNTNTNDAVRTQVSQKKKVN